MKIYKVLLIFIGLLLLAGCEKASPDGLQGRWKPVYASFDTEDVLPGYCAVYDGPVDAHGGFTQLLISMDHPDVRYENQAMLPGYRFFRKNGKDVFTTFFLDFPGEEIDQPLMYKIENGKIYFEWPKGAFINGSLDYLHEGSGKFDEGSPFSFRPDGQLIIGSVTYTRM